MSYYYTAQICRNGHIITAYADKYPEGRGNYCSDCGAETIMCCPTCSTNIRGRSSSEFGYIGDYKAPSYCPNCGTPYPWTESALLAIAALINEDDELTDDDKSRLKESLTDIITETPKTQLATVRMKKALSMAGKFTADALRQFVIDFGVELVKRQMTV